MSRSIALFLLLLILPAATAWGGQPLNTIVLKGGAYNGTQDYDFGGEQLFDPSACWTATGGLGFEWKFGRHSNFRLLTEFMYVSKNIEEEVPELDELGQPTGNILKVQGGFDYLSIPVMAKLQTADQPSSLYFLVGLSGDLILQRDVTLTIFEDFKDFVVSAQVGVGIENAFSRYWGWLLEFSYIQNIYSAYGGDDLGEEIRLNSVRQRGITILAGLRFLLG